MTDSEIIKALEYCKDCSANLNVEIIDLITRQQAENENLKVENQSLRSAANSLKMHYEKAQAEIERLRKEVNLVSIQFQDLQERYEEARAEIERLKRELDLVIENSISARYPHCVLCGNGAILTKSLEEYDELIADISAEAYKECLAKVKNYIKTHCNPYGKPDFDYDTSIKILNFIDNLVKEMVGDDNA